MIDAQDITDELVANGALIAAARAAVPALIARIRSAQQPAPDDTLAAAVRELAEKWVSWDGDGQERGFLDCAADLRALLAAKGE